VIEPRLHLVQAELFEVVSVVSKGETKVGIKTPYQTDIGRLTILPKLSARAFDTLSELSIIMLHSII